MFQFRFQTGARGQRAKLISIVAQQKERYAGAESCQQGGSIRLIKLYFLPLQALKA